MSDVSRCKFVLTGILMLLFFMGFLLTLQPTPAAALASSATPLPTATTTAVPNVDLPTWMNDPNTAVFVLFPYQNSDAVEGATFVNAVTDERFKLDLSYVDDVRWIKAADGVYIDLGRYLSNGFNEYINLATGTLQRLGFDGTGAPIAAKDLPPPAARDNGANMRYELVAQTYWVADDGHDTFHTQTYSDLLLTDTITGETESLYNYQLPGNGAQQLGVQWFDNGQRLGVWIHYPGDTNQSEAGDHVDVFDTSGTLLFSLDQLLQVRWSARHSKMLYRDYYDADSICVVDLLSSDSQDSKCTFFPNWQNQQQSRIQDYQWSLDGQKIIFTYTGDDSQSGGLCIADAVTFAVNCPIKKAFSEGDFSGDYLEQPDNTYALFSYAEAATSSDNAGEPYETGLCLLNQETYAADCFTERLVPVGSYDSGLSFAPSGHVAVMLYTRRNPDGRSGLCSIDLQGGAVNCPNTSTMNGIIDTYGWSPDSRFFLVIDNYGPSSDDKSNSHYGLFDITAGMYRDEGYGLWMTNDLTNLWRPALKP